MQIINDPKLDFKDVLIMPKVSTLGSRSDVNINREFQYIDLAGNKRHFTCVPIIASNMDGVGTFSMAKSISAHGCLTAICKHEPLEKWNSLPNYTLPILSMGRTDGRELLKIRDWMDNNWCWGLPKVCIDVANGYSEDFIEFVSMAREILPIHTFIIAGNVVTPSQTERLILAGANAVKVGIGSGSVCTTRKVTGVGYPQLSAIMECADAAHGMNGFVVSDGGCQVPGDVCKAFGAGADFVMLGGMLAGHDESEIHEDVIKFHGSSSKAAQTRDGKELAEYRSSEGKEVEIKYRGPVENTIKHILGGLRSCCTYCGARKLKELSKRTTFVRVYNGAQYNTVFGDSNEVT